MGCDSALAKYQRDHPSDVDWRATLTLSPILAIIMHIQTGTFPDRFRLKYGC
jgi:hypothetical protein